MSPTMPFRLPSYFFSRTFLGLLKLLLCALLGGIAWGSWYLHNRGLNHTWRERVSAELRKQGLDATMARLTFDPFAGLVASDLRVRDAEGNLFAQVSEASLDINLNKLFRGEPFLNALDLRDAAIAIPINPAKAHGAKLEVAKLNARLLFPPDQIRITQAAFEVSGIQVRASGTLLNAHKLGARAPQQQRENREFLEHLFAELRKFRFPATPPTLDLEFVGDFEQADALRVEKALLQADRIERGSLVLRSLTADVTYQDGEVRLKQCSASDAYGTLFLAGDFRPATGEGSVQLRSNMDLLAATKEFMRDQKPLEFSLSTPPTIEAFATLHLKAQPAFQVLGRVTQEKFSIRKIDFKSFRAAFSWDGDRLLVEDIRLAHATGAVSGRVYHAKDDFRLEVESTLDPRIFAPLADAKAAEFIKQWEFQAPPVLRLTANGTAPSFGAITVEGKLVLGKGSFRGVGFNAASCGIVVRDKSLSADRFRVDRPEGSATGTFVLDLGKGEARLEQAVTTVNPQEASVWIDQPMVRNVAPYRFRVPPTLKMGGTIKLHGAKGSRFELLVSGGSMDYTFLDKVLTVTNPSARLLFENDRLYLQDVNGGLLGGRIEGEASISLIKNAPDHIAKIVAREIDFAALTKLYFGYNESKGLLSGTYSFTGKGPDARTMRGTADLEVLNGNVFAIPFLGPLSGFINEIVPGMGYSNARRASANVSVHDGLINTDSLVADSPGFTMTGGGTLAFLDDKMDFSVRINAKGLPGILLFPVSKLFEYVSDGPLHKPVWRPKRLPKEMFGR